MKKRLYLLCNLLVVGAVLLCGCSSELMLSEADKEILDTATQEYSALRNTMSPDEVRAELVEKLNTEYEGIESAELGADGYTIFIEFTDDDFAGISTLEESELSPESPGNHHSFDHEETPRAADHFIDILQQQFIHQGEMASDGEEEKSTPQSNKVLILNPLRPDESYIEGFPEVFADYLKEYGWTDDDIVVKSPGTNITPADYSNLSEYGIILYFGHGGYWKDVKNETNDRNVGDIIVTAYYIQCCMADETLFQNNSQYGEWKKQKKLIVIKRLSQGYDLGMRLDLLKELMGVLPSSYVHLSTCYGYNASSVFYEDGAKVFLSWDKPVSGVISDGDQLGMLQLMLGNNSSAYEAYLDDTIVKSDNCGFGLATFKIYPDSSGSPNAGNFYLPAWINLTVTGIPEGTSFIRAGVYDKDSNLLAQDDEEVSAGVTQVEMKEVGGLMFAPTEEVRVEAQAFDSSNQELDSGQVTTTLNAGANLLEVQLGITAEMRRELWGPYTYQEGDVWKVTGGGYVIAVWKGEDRAYTAILYKPGVDPMNLTYSAEKVYTKDEVMARFFGDNVWKLADDEVAVVIASLEYTGFGGSVQEVLDRFNRLFEDWEQTIKDYLLWRLEIIE